MKTIKERMQETIDYIISSMGKFEIKYLIPEFIRINAIDWDGAAPVITRKYYVSYVKTFAPDTVGFMTDDGSEHFIKLNKVGKIYLSERVGTYDESKALTEVSFTKFSGYKTGIAVSGGGGTAPRFYSRKAKATAAPIHTSTTMVASAAAPTPAAVTTGSTGDGKSFEVVLSGPVTLNDEQRKLIVLKFWEEHPDDLITLLGTEKVLEKIGVAKAMEHFS